MIVLEANIKHARRNRDFGRVEALVELIIKQPGHPTRRRIIMTSQPVTGLSPLRQRLTGDAALLVRGLETPHPISACAA